MDKRKKDAVKILFLLFTAILFQSSLFSQAPAPDLWNWYRGNTHTHGEFCDASDFNDVPMIASWYRKAGYNFLILSEHNNHLLKRKVFCYDRLSRPKKNFIMLCGLELSMSTHVTALGINKFLAGEETLQEAVDMTVAAGGLPILNHPMSPVVTARKFISTEGLNHIEIVNGGRLHQIDASVALWDSILSAPDGRLVYAVAADDNHFNKNRVGLGWIMVRAESLTKENIRESMQAGNFYPTTGVLLNDFRLENNVFTVSSLNGETIKFFGVNGTLLKTVEASEASYTLTGDELYIRAEVTNSEGKTAWTQPFMVLRPENRL